MTEMKEYKFDIKQSMLVHLQTGETQAIVDRDGEVLGLLEQLPQKGAVLEPNPSACKGCAYADKVLRCEETGFVIGS